MSEKLLKSIRNGIWVLIVMNVFMIGFATWWNYYLTVRAMEVQYKSVPGAELTAELQPMLEAGEYQSLIDRCESELKRKPFSPVAHFYAGAGHYHAGDLVEAKAQFLETVKVDPSWNVSVDPWLEALEGPE